MPTYARALGARIGRQVDLHSLPPVTGLLSLGDGCSVEPEVDLSGHWLDGDVLHIGRVEVGADARVGARSTLGPGAVVGRGAEVAPGSGVIGTVAPGEFWSGSPAEPVGQARGPWSGSRPSYRPGWVLAYAGASLPLLVLIVALDDPFGQVLTDQLVATELVRSAVGTIGLIAAVPITTAAAAVVALRGGRRDPGDGDRAAAP